MVIPLLANQDLTPMLTDLHFLGFMLFVVYYVNMPLMTPGQRVADKFFNLGIAKHNFIRIYFF